MNHAGDERIAGFEMVVGFIGRIVPIRKIVVISIGPGHVFG
jgi:hypothetical protein